MTVELQAHKGWGQVTAEGQVVITDSGLSVALRWRERWEMDCQSQSRFSYRIRGLVVNGLALCHFLCCIFFYLWKFKRGGECATHV